MFFSLVYVSDCLDNVLSFRNQVYPAKEIFISIAPPWYSIELCHDLGMSVSLWDRPVQRQGKWWLHKERGLWQRSQWSPGSVPSQIYLPRAPKPVYVHLVLPEKSGTGGDQSVFKKIVQNIRLRIYRPSASFLFGSVSGMVFGKGLWVLLLRQQLN